MLMPVVYIAGPYRAKPDPNNQYVQTLNIRRAEALAHDVWSMGAAALCPHLNTANFQGSLPDQVWLDGDLAMLAKCDAVLMTPDWELSAGARVEQQFALDRGIPVFYSPVEMIYWLSEFDRAAA